MALFSRNKDLPAQAGKKTEEKGVATKEAKKPAVSKTLPTDRDLSSVIIKPRITEKAVGQGEKNVYTFIVRRDATKYDVRDAVKELFNVTPVKVNIVNKSHRQFMSRSKGRKITEKGMKKAYVYLKQGEHIDLA
jgi:large subunit ribosomal protein L23